MEAGSKRKRDLRCPRITFHAPDRTFERLLREDSLKDLKTAVKTKLGLGQNVEISLSQVRSGSNVVLEDEDDFDAFYNVLHSSDTASVRVIVEQTTTGDNSQVEQPVQTSKKKKQKLDVVPQHSPAPSRDDVAPALITSTPASTSKKRAVSFVQPGVSKPIEVNAIDGPPAKRSKTTSIVIEPSDTLIYTPAAPPPAHEQGGASSNAAPTAEKSKNPPISATLAPEPSSSALSAQGADADEKKSRKTKTKATRETNPEIAGTPADSSEKSIARAIERAIKVPKRRQPAVEITQKASRLVATPLAKEQPANDGGSQKGAKAKKTHSNTANPLSEGTPTSEPPKKPARSKSRVRKTTSGADSESSDAVSPVLGSQIKESLSTITRLMIEKYLTPAPSTDDVVATAPIEALTASEPSAIIQPSAIPSKAKAKPTCPYCGKILTHDRSHCPMIRAKNPDIIEQRIAELSQDTAEDVDNVRADAVEVLKAALLRKRGAETKKKASSNVNTDVTSSERSSTKPLPSTKPLSTIGETSSFTKVTPVGRRIPSPPSPPSNSSSEEDIPLQKTSQKHSSSSKPAPRGFPPQKSSSPSLISQTFPKPSLETPKTVPATTLTDSESEAENSSEAETFQSQAVAGARATSLGRNSDDESSISPEDELSAVQNSPPQPDAPHLADMLGYSDKDLEAVIRGPGTPLKSTELPSSESSEDEEMEDVQLDDVSEEEEESRRHSRKSRRSYALNNDSSDEEVGENDEDEDEMFHTPSSHESVVSKPPLVARAPETRDELTNMQPVSLPAPEQSQPSQGSASFQEMDGRLSSVETDKAGNDAFEQVLAEENAVLDLARKDLPCPTVKELTPHPAMESPRISSEPDQGVGAEAQESISTEPEAKEARSPRNNLLEVVEEVEPAQTTGSDPIEAPETLEDSHMRQRSPIEAAEDYEGTSTPALPPPEPSPQEPERAATPKPGIFQRMKNHTSFASAPKRQTSSLNSNLNLTVAPGAKPREARAAARRSQQSLESNSSAKPRVARAAARRSRQSFGSSSNQDVGPSHGGNAGSAVTDGSGPATSGKLNSREHVSRPMSTRSMTAAEKEVEQARLSEEPGPPPRPSTRAAARIAAANPRPPIASTPNGLQPSTRRSHPIKAASISEDIGKPFQFVTEKQVKGTKRTKGEAKAVAKSPTSSPKEDIRPDALESQTTELEQEVPLPPSPPISLDAWETMQPETPGGATHSDVMVDELLSDGETMIPIPFPLKPQFQRKSAALSRKHSLPHLEVIHSSEDRSKDETRDNAEEDLLFMPSESQTAFPHSQFRSQMPGPQDPVSSDSEEEVRKTVVKKLSLSQPQPSRYRKLSDIASQATKLFTPNVLKRSTGWLQNAASVPTKRKERLNQMYGMMGMKNGDDGSDDGSEKGSESDAETSHIPNSRKAGAGLKARTSVA